MEVPDIYEICIKDPIRYGELRRAIPRITGTILSSSLKELESDGLVTRMQYNEIPVRMEYSLINRGSDLSRCSTRWPAWA